MEQMKKLIIGTPNEKQKLLLQCRKKYIALGGARGGGKSWAVRTKAKLMALHYPGIRLLLVRRSYPDVENNHVRFLRAELAGIAEYRATARQFVFPNGSVLERIFRIHLTFSPQSWCPMSSFYSSIRSWRASCPAAISP